MVAKGQSVLFHKDLIAEFRVVQFPERLQKEFNIFSVRVRKLRFHRIFYQYINHCVNFMLSYHRKNSNKSSIFSWFVSEIFYFTVYFTCILIIVFLLML